VRVIKTFSATMAKDREALGDHVTSWLRLHDDVTVDEIRTLQSSDSEYHCLSVIIIGRRLEITPTKVPGAGKEVPR